MAIDITTPDVGGDADLTSWAAVTRAAGFDAFAATPTSANLRALITDETGTGLIYFQGGALGTPASATLTNATGLPITGLVGLGTGVATALGINVGSAGAPVLFNGALGTPSSATLTNATGLPISTGVSGLGTGIATFLATPTSANLRAAVTDESGSGALLFAGGALGIPASGTLTNCTGLPSAGVITGTSGAAIPLLNGANTWSGAQSLANNIALNIVETGGQARSAVKMNASNVMEFGNANNNASFLNASSTFSGDVRFSTAPGPQFNSPFIGFYNAVGARKGYIQAQAASTFLIAAESDTVGVRLNTNAGGATIDGDPVMTRGATEAVTGTKTFSAPVTISSTGGNFANYWTNTTQTDQMGVALSGSTGGTWYYLPRPAGTSDTTKIFGYNFTGGNWYFNSGFVVGSPTGGYKGSGTINAQAVYDDNVLLTDLVSEFAATGTWDREKYANHPVAGEMSAFWFDPAQYAEFWKANHYLPGMVTWADPANRPSSGEMITRLVAVVETQAALIDNLHRRLTVLEAAQ